MTTNKQTVDYDIPTRLIPDKKQRLALKKAGEAVDQMLIEHGLELCLIRCKMWVKAIGL